MKNEHILRILDEKIFAEISEAETAVILKHGEKCQVCAEAYKAAKITAALLQTQAAQSVEPSPFFHKRVMANLRDKQIAAKPFAAFARVWRASRMLVAMMSLVVVCLVGLTLYTTAAKQSAAILNPPAFDNYSADMVILGERLPSREPTNEQVFQILYGANSKRHAERGK